MTLKLLTWQLLYYFVLMFCIILQKMQTSVKVFCWSYASCLYFQMLQHTIVKLFDTGFFFFFFFFFLHSEHFINTLKIAGNYVMWLPSKGILLFVWFVIPVIHAIASSFFVRFCWFLQKKKMLLLGKFWDTWEIYINFLKLYIMIAKLHTRFEDCTTFYSNTKSEKKDFLPPLSLTEKWLTYQKKPIRQS